MKHNIASDTNWKTIWQMICILAIVAVGIYSHIHTPEKHRTNKYITKK